MCSGEVLLAESDYAGLQQRDASTLSSSRCLEEALGTFAVRFLMRIFICEFDSIQVSSDLVVAEE